MRRSTFILTDVKHDGVASSVGGFSACLVKVPLMSCVADGRC